LVYKVFSKKPGKDIPVVSKERIEAAKAAYAKLAKKALGAGTPGASCSYTHV